MLKIKKIDENHFNQEEEKKMEPNEQAENVAVKKEESQSLR